MRFFNSALLLLHHFKLHFPVGFIAAVTIDSPHPQHVSPGLQIGHLNFNILPELRLIIFKIEGDAQLIFALVGPAQKVNGTNLIIEPKSVQPLGPSCM